MMFTGDKITGVEAAEMGLMLRSVPDDHLDHEVEALAARMATVLDGISRHSPEGMNFKARVEKVGWRQAVQDRDKGTFDWTENKPVKE